MNERAMQFQIGMFAIVSALVLTVLVIWFGEKPGLFRNEMYVAVHFVEAPGVTIGVPVRRSGLRVGEVVDVTFDNRDGQDGVIVVLALERDPRVLDAARARIARSIIGDVTIELVPDREALPFEASKTPAESLHNAINEGDPPVDPTRLLEIASGAMGTVTETLEAIKGAADQINIVAKKTDQLEGFLMTWGETGKKMTVVADDVHRFVEANEQNLQPTLNNLAEIARKVNAALDDETQAEFKSAIHNISTASAKIDVIATSLEPLARDLGNNPSKVPPTTGTGQLVARMNRIAFDVSLLTDKLYDPRGGPDRKGGLNMNGSLQKLLTTSDLYDNLNGVAVNASEMMTSARPVVNNLREFTGKIANNPSELGRGALRP